MKIRMLVQMGDGALRDGEPWPKQGEVADLPTAEAAHLVAAGVAEQADDEDQEQDAKATVPAPRRRKPRGGGGRADGDRS